MQLIEIITPLNIFSIIISIAIAGLLIWNHRDLARAVIVLLNGLAQTLAVVLKGIGQTLASFARGGGNLGEKIFSRTTFFWVVNITFMAISAYHAAPFFGAVTSNLTGLEWIAPYIGIPVAIVIDGITIVFMQARLEANYKRDRKKANMYLRYVAAGALLNTVANLYTDIQHFKSTDYGHVGPLLLNAAPLVLSIFPMFLVAIGKAADEMISARPLDKIDVEEYRLQEEKRVGILEANNEYLEREALAEQKKIEIELLQKQNANLRKGKKPKEPKAPKVKAPKVDREFILLRWIYPERQAIHTTNAIAELQNELAKFRSDFRADLAKTKNEISGETKNEISKFRADINEANENFVGQFRDEIISLLAKTKNEISSEAKNENENFVGQFRDEIISLINETKRNFVFAGEISNETKNEILVLRDELAEALSQLRGELNEISSETKQNEISQVRQLNETKEELYQQLQEIKSTVVLSLPATNVSELNEYKTTKTQQNTGPLQQLPKDLPKISPNLAKKDENTFDKRNFVLRCWAENPEMKGVEIKRRAEQDGHKILDSYISDLRKEFRSSASEISPRNENFGLDEKTKISS